MQVTEFHGGWSQNIYKVPHRTHSPPPPTGTPSHYFPRALDVTAISPTTAPFAHYDRVPDSRVHRTVNSAVENSSDARAAPMPAPSPRPTSLLSPPTPVTVDLISNAAPLVDLTSHGCSTSSHTLHRLSISPHTSFWVLDTSIDVSSTALSTLAEDAPWRLLIRPLGRLNEPVDRAFMMRLRRPFPWVAPRACATSARLTAR